MVAAAILAQMRQDEAGPYGWIIDTDDGEVYEGVESGTMGPRDLPDSLRSQLVYEGSGERFRLCYADGEVAYSGRYIGGEGDKDMPLEDFGRPNAGCSYIEYLTESGDWKAFG